MPLGLIRLEGREILNLMQSLKHPVESWNEDLCRKVANAAIGKEVPYDVLSYRPWVLSRQVSEKYRVGRVFL